MRGVFGLHGMGRVTWALTEMRLDHSFGAFLGEVEEVEQSEGWVLCSHPTVDVCPFNATASSIGRRICSMIDIQWIN